MFAMKNAKACAIACTLVLSLGLAACGGSGNDTKAATTDTATEETTTVVETETAEVTDTTAETTPADTTTTDAAAVETTTTEAPAQATYIGDDQAIAIALENAGADRASVAELECELDTDDPTVHYDVDFKFNGLEYDYDINATTGEIISAYSEIDD